MDLFKAAAAVRQNAYVPYSNFKVGAAIRSSAGNIYAGCNVENVAYPEGTCAEAGAIAAMVAAGETEIAEILVVAGGDFQITPCGGCRQKIAEFAAKGASVYLADLSGEFEKVNVQDLLPGSFTKAHLDHA